MFETVKFLIGEFLFCHDMAVYYPFFSSTSYMKLIRTIILTFIQKTVLKQTDVTFIFRLGFDSMYLLRTYILFFIFIFCSEEHIGTAKVGPNTSISNRILLHNTFYIRTKFTHYFIYILYEFIFFLIFINQKLTSSTEPLAFRDTPRQFSSVALLVAHGVTKVTKNAFVCHLMIFMIFMVNCLCLRLIPKTIITVIYFFKIRPYYHYITVF